MLHPPFDNPFVISAVIALFGNTVNGIFNTIVTWQRHRYDIKDRQFKQIVLQDKIDKVYEEVNGKMLVKIRTAVKDAVQLETPLVRLPPVLSESGEHIVLRKVDKP